MNVVAGSTPTEIRQVLSVLIVFSLLGAALWTLRGGGRAAIFLAPWKRTSTKSQSLKRVEKLALTPQHTLHLVHLKGRDIVVATHPQGCTLIGCSSTILDSTTLDSTTVDSTMIDFTPMERGSRA
jgi:hypothetical protein